VDRGATADLGSAISVLVDGVEATAKVSSISPSGLAILHLHEPAEPIRALLAQTMDGNSQIGVRSGQNGPFVDVTLVWFEEREGEGAEGRHLELIVDGSESPAWAGVVAGAGVSH
jgi:hypothetical protein